MSGLSVKDPNTAELAKTFAAQLVVEFKADNTFSFAGMTGTYAVSGHTVTLTPTAAPGMSKEASKPATATLADDGKSLTLAGGGSGKSMKFTKASS
jgi:hypothetical protein